MGRPLYSLDENQSVRGRQRKKAENAVLLEREGITHWSVGAFDPDSDDFFVKAIEEFGLPGTAKEVASRRATGVVLEEPVADSSRETADSDPSWANSPSWPMFDADNHLHPDAPSESNESVPVTSPDDVHTHIQPHYHQSTTLPSSQSARTPEPWVAELAPISPPFTEESDPVLPPSMVPTTPRQTLDLTPLLWTDVNDSVDIPSRGTHVIPTMEEFRRIPQAAR